MDNKLTIINYLGKKHKQSFTMHELSMKLNIPYASFYRTIQEIKDLIIITSVGKAKTIQLNKSNPVITAYLTISSDEEKKEFLSKQPLIKKIAEELQTKEIVVLFGSYAKALQNEKSDIDIIIINNNGKKSLSFSKYELLFKKKINPVYVTKKEFQSMLQDQQENIGKQVVKDHIILNNPQSFWGCVIHEI